MVSKTDDIPASVPSCNPADLADEAGDGAQDGKETSKTRLKESCGCGESLVFLHSCIEHTLKHSNLHLHTGSITVHSIVLAAIE